MKSPSKAKPTRSSASRATPPQRLTPAKSARKRKRTTTPKVQVQVIDNDNQNFGGAITLMSLVSLGLSMVTFMFMLAILIILADMNSKMQPATVDFQWELPSEPVEPALLQPTPQPHCEVWMQRGTERSCAL